MAGDRGGGELKPATRFDHPQQKGAFVFEQGIDENVFRIACGKGVSGGALEVVDVLPRRGRIFFPARGNLAYAPGGFDGAASYWITTDPNRCYFFAPGHWARMPLAVPDIPYQRSESVCTSITFGAPRRSTLWL